MNSSGIPKLLFKKLKPNALPPSKGSKLAAGYDLHSCVDLVVPPKDKALVGTGLAIAVPPGNYGRVAPRSGLAWKNFIDVGAGVVDADYRGEGKILKSWLVCVILFNFSDKEFPVKAGDRIAQLIIEKITDTELVETEDLDDTERGVGGFGSTGVGKEVSTKSVITTTSEWCEYDL